MDDDKKIGYIAITSFQEDTPEEFDNAIEDLLQKGMQALILDLRFNPGGLLDTSVEVADKFLEEGVIVSTKGRDKSQDHIYRAEKPGTYTNFPIVVLINKGSAVVGPGGGRHKEQQPRITRRHNDIWKGLGPEPCAGREGGKCHKTHYRKVLYTLRKVNPQRRHSAGYCCRTQHRRDKKPARIYVQAKQRRQSQKRQR